MCGCDPVAIGLQRREAGERLFPKGWPWTMIRQVVTPVFQPACADWKVGITGKGFMAGDILMAALWPGWSRSHACLALKTTRARFAAARNPAPSRSLEVTLILRPVYFPSTALRSWPRQPQCRDASVRRANQPVKVSRPGTPGRAAGPELHILRHARLHPLPCHGDTATLATASHFASARSRSNNVGCE